MKALRLFAWFLCGVVLAFLPWAAHADQPASYWNDPFSGTQGTRNTAALMAQLVCNTWYGSQAASFNQVTSYGEQWKCGASQLIGVAPVCPSGSTRTNNICSGTAACAKSSNDKVGDSYRINWPPLPGVQFCTQGCSTYPGPGRNRQNGTAVVEMFVNGAGGSASNCTTGGNEQTPNAYSEPATTAPPCLAGQGSYSSLGGVVMCVAGTTPNATVPPVVTKKNDTTSYPDGSTKTTTTTNTCTGDGACSTTTTTTATGATGGGAGLAGTPGTTSQQQNKPAEETSDFCAKNPTLQLCKGGMNEEVTQKKVLTELERFNAPSQTDDSALTDQKTFEPSEAQIQHESKLLDTVAGIVTNSTVESNKSAWAVAMASGWLTPITLTGCQPIVSTFAGKTWTLDHCPVAEKISVIGSYALWFMFAVSMFVMVTGGRNN